MANKSGSGYLINAAVTPELFQSLSLARAFQGKDKEKPGYTYSSLRYEQGGYTITSSDGYRTIAVHTELPMELTGFFGTEAVIKIESVNAALLFIPYHDFSDETGFSDWGKAIPDVDLFEGIKLQIASKREGEASENTRGNAFSQAAYAMQEFIGKPIAYSHIELFQRMEVEVLRHKSPHYRDMFLVRSENESFTFTAMMTPLECIRIDEASAQMCDEALANGGYVENGRLLYHLRIVQTKRQARKFVW
jgi:hypothetical protein